MFCIVKFSLTLIRMFDDEVSGFWPECLILSQNCTCSKIRPQSSCLQDALACEMFQLISKEAELATTVLEYARLQRSYHQAALATLDEMIPELESTICKHA